MAVADVVLIGGGAIGCAIARALTKRGRQVIVLEKNSICGFETSSRSSEVLHAGIYYQPGSYKAKYCIEGREKLVQYMLDRNIPYNLCGKFIVSTSHQKETSYANELEKLQKIYENGQKNGLNNLEWWAGGEVQTKEPEVHCSAAIFSPYTGIFDTHSVLDSFQVEILESQTSSDIVCNCIFESASYNSITQLYTSQTSLGSITSKALINASGLYAIQNAAKIKDYPLLLLPKCYYAKGRYLKIAQQRKPFQHLIYPLPTSAGLGIHATINLEGYIRFGPDVQWIKNTGEAISKIPSVITEILLSEYEHSIPHLNHYQPNYQIDLENDPTLIPSFLQDIIRYWPNVQQVDLLPDYAGIRPKIVGPGQAGADFLILTEQDHQHHFPNLIQLFGIESPGWTSCLAIADHVAKMIR
jgi:L-2-hydroxyglutarate oxidase LhgO